MEITWQEASGVLHSASAIHMSKYQVFSEMEPLPNSGMYQYAYATLGVYRILVFSNPSLCKSATVVSYLILHFHFLLPSAFEMLLRIHRQISRINVLF